MVTWTSRNRLSLDGPIASVSLVCQLLMLAHCCHGTHFPQQVQHLLSSLLHFIGIVKDCQDFRLPGIVIQKDSFPAHLSRRLGVYSPCAPDGNPRFPLE